MPLPAHPPSSLLAPSNHDLPCPPVHRRTAMRLQSVLYCWCTATHTAVLLQMTAGTSQLAGEMAAYIRQTQESKGQQITVLKQASSWGK